MNILRLVAVGALAAVVLAACSQAPKQADISATQHTSVTLRPIPKGASAKLYGVAVLGVKESLAPVQKFATEIGQKPRIASAYYGWGELPSVPVLRATSRYGAVPLLNLNSDQEPLPVIVSGAQDGYLSKLGRRLAKLHTPVVLSFDSEMNGPWYPWGSRYVTPSTFIAAFRHVHDVVREAGAKNVIWMWAPNITERVTEPIALLWPGSRYVNWVGLHGYFILPTDTFASRFLPTLASIRRLTGDPVLISETAAAPGTDRPSQIRNLISGVASARGVIGFVWFDYNARMKWQIDSDPPALQAFRQALSSPGWRSGYIFLRPKLMPAIG